MAPTEPFTLKGNRYDQNTFLGRLRAIIDLFNPKQLLRSEADIAGVACVHAARNKLLSSGVLGCEQWSTRGLGLAWLHLGCLYSRAHLTAMESSCAFAALAAEGASSIFFGPQSTCRVHVHVHRNEAHRPASVVLAVPTVR